MAAVLIHSLNVSRTDIECAWLKQKKKAETKLVLLSCYCADIMMTMMMMMIMMMMMMMMMMTMTTMMMMMITNGDDTKYVHVNRPSGEKCKDIDYVI